MEARLDLAAIMSRVRQRGAAISEPMAFGLGAGLYFEYFQRPHASPSRFFTGHNRYLERGLETRLGQFFEGDRPTAIRDAMRANALAMDIDRAPAAAIMGMELLAEDLESWAAARDYRVCAFEAARTIRQTGSLYRRHGVEFLIEAAQWFRAAGDFAPALDSIADEWDLLADSLAEVGAGVVEDDFERASRLIRRLALREEHFWGRVLEATGD